jgi:hypothetical protein
VAASGGDAAAVEATAENDLMIGIGRDRATR